MKKWYGKGIINDLKGVIKNCFIAMFIESTEEIAKEAAKQHIGRAKQAQEQQRA